MSEKNDETDQLTNLITNSKEIQSDCYNCSKSFKEGLRLRLYEAYLSDGASSHSLSLQQLFINRKFLVASSLVLSSFLVAGFSGFSPISNFFPSRQGSIVQAAEPNYMQGDISVFKKGASNWTAMEPNELFSDGDEIKTGESALLALHLNDGTVFRLAPQSYVKLLSFSNNSVEIEHMSGALYTHIAESSDYSMRIYAGREIQASPGAIFLSYRDSNTTLPYIDTLQRSITFQSANLSVKEGQRVYLSHDGELLSLYEYNRDLQNQDDFLTWNISMDINRGLGVGLLADTTPPDVVFHFPTGNAERLEAIPVTFKVQDDSGIAWVKVNNEYVNPDKDGNCKTLVDLSDNQDSLIVRVKDNAWNVTHQEILVVQ